MKTLYFDIDGTILLADEDRLKSCLEGGRLESAVRRAGFQRLVCVGNYCRIAHVVREMGVEYDDLGVLLQICRGAFSNHRWFRAVTTLVADPENRAQYIDFTSNWWYVDDLAEEYLHKASRESVLEGPERDRVLIPSATGDGQDVLDWLNRVV